MRPSTLYKIYSDLYALLFFELWDDASRIVLDSYMKSNNLSYTAPTSLDNNKLKILIHDNDEIYTIII